MAETDKVVEVQRVLEIKVLPPQPCTARWTCNLGDEHQIAVTHIGQKIAVNDLCVPPTFYDVDLLHY